VPLLTTRDDHSTACHFSEDSAKRFTKQTV